MVLVDFDRKNWVLADYGRKNWCLYQTNWFWLILTGKNWGLTKKKQGLVDFELKN